MGQEVTNMSTPNDLLNYRINLWRLEDLLGGLKVERANHKILGVLSQATIDCLQWAVDTLQVPPNWEEQLHKAQQEAEFANEELRRVRMEVENGD